jgi:hypothetical protein
MERTPVSSSNIQSIGYDSDSQTLEIEFIKSGIYQYHGVPSEEHQAMMNSDSMGKYFNAHIKGRYSESKL